MSYRLILPALSPLLLGYTIWRSCKDGGWSYLQQRLGFNYPAEARSADLWVHAASVGEVTTVLPLLESVLASSENSINSIFLTTNTPTARQVLIKRNVSGITHAYLPLDFRFCCLRFCLQLRTKKAWIVETEIWPSLYAVCRQHKIALTIINGRLSDKTMNHAGGLLRESYKSALYDVQVLARSSEDAERFASIGADPVKVTTIGNLKYMESHQQQDLTPLLDRDYVVAASTHDDEELRLARMWIKDNNLPLLVIVPRHPERASAILQALSHGSESHIAQRSLGETPQPEDKLYLADTLGELNTWYFGAQAAFVGGSLIDRGGHNMLEPARLGVPIFVGPHTDNFTDVMQAMQENNAISVALDEQELTAMLKSAAEGHDPYAERARNAFALAESFANVGELYMKALII